MQNRISHLFRVLKFKVVSFLPHIDLCSICGSFLFFRELNRESVSCACCGSYWRTRSLIDAIMFNYKYYNFGNELAFKDLKSDFSTISLGMSDDISITSVLPSKFSHTNSFYDNFPKVDLLNIDDHLHNHFNLVLCSDVFEHIPKNIELAFTNLYKIVKTDGLLVFSVPIVKVKDRNYKFGQRTSANLINSVYKEYYPLMKSWEYREHGNLVVWEDLDGNFHEDTEPEFHGGVGLTLTFRLFSEDSVKSFLELSGFRDVRKFVNPVKKRNIRDGVIFTAWK